MKNEIRLLVIAIMVIATLPVNCLAQFIDSSNPFDRIELYYNANRDLEMRLTLKVKEEEALYTPSTFQVIYLKNTYHPIDSKLKPIQLDEYNIAIKKNVNDREIRVSLDNHRPFLDKKLGETTHAWSKAEFAIGYKLASDDVLRESTTYVVYPTLKRIDQEESVPNVEFARIDSENAKLVNIEISFDPIPEHPITHLNVSAKKNGDGHQINSDGTFDKLSENKYRLRLKASSGDIASGRYIFGFSYGINGEDRRNEVSSLISDPAPIRKILKVEFMDDGIPVEVKGQIINVSENRVYRMRVTFNSEIEDVGIKYGPKLTKLAKPTEGSKSKSNFHDFDFDFKNMNIPDDIYEVSFQALSGGKNVINGNTQYIINKNTKRVVKFVRYEAATDGETKFTYRLDDKADDNRNLTIGMSGEPTAKLSTSSDRIEWTHSISNTDIQKELGDRKSGLIQFDITYDNTKIFTFETLVLSKAQADELNTAINKAIEQVSKAPKSSSASALVDIAKKEIKEVLSVPEGKLDSEVENVSSFVVDLVSKSKLNKKNFKEVAGSVGKFALKALKAIVLPV